MSINIKAGMFVPTTQVYNAGSIQRMDSDSEEFRNLLVTLYQSINNIAVVLNHKTSGYYTLNEFVNGNVFFPNPASTEVNVFRQEYHKVVNFGALPNTGVKSVAHGITVTSSFIWTGVGAYATDPIGLTGLQIPYASPTDANEIEINVDATNVNITTGSNRTNYTTCYVILSFLKQ